MTFRLPFQILRAVSRPTSPHQIFNPKDSIRSGYVSNINYSSFVDANNNNRRLVESTQACFLKLPHYPSSHRFINTFLENRKKVRRQNKCHEKKCERRLEFRQTTREDCEQCIIPVPDKCPKLHRLKPAYDESKLKWKHEECVDFCADAQRADDIRGYKIVKKKLPNLEPSKDCMPCTLCLPTKAPKLYRPKKLFNYKTDPKRICPQNLCNIDPPRMDDVLGVKVVPKELPKLPKSDDCPNCIPHVPKYAPNLIRLTRKYNYKTDPKRECPKDLCNIDPPRMDDVRGYKVTPKTLPNLDPKDCAPCIGFVPTKAPKLCRPKKLFNYKTDPERICPKNLCNIDPPRMDDVVGLKIEKKSLPNIPAGNCEWCANDVPTSSPELIRPKKLFDDSKMKFNHYCPEDICEPGPERMDDVRGHKIQKKKLPKLIPSEECTYCRNQFPTTAPKLCRLKRLYNYKTDPERICPKDLCNIDPPRMDDVRGYKVTPKTLPNLDPIDCAPCIGFVPTKAPKLCRPKKLFNYKTDPERICPKNLCNIDPPRMDDVLGVKVVPKELPKLPKSDDCPNCKPYVPKYAPTLVRPTRKYNYKTDPKRECPKDLCNIDPPRMDDVVGYKVISKKLPNIPAPNDCQECVNFVPKYAPELKRPKKTYSYKLDKPRICPKELCNLDPPRMDDVRCWKPKKKILPSLNCQARQYSTFTSPSNRVTYSVNSTKNYFKLHEKIFLYSRLYSKSSKKPPISLKPKKGIRVCPKFKLKECKPCARKVCFTLENKKCTKVEAPYTSFGDRSDGFYEKEASECTDFYQVMMQPQKQVQGHFYKLKAPPPKFGRIDPSLERKCLACRGADASEPISEPLENQKDCVSACPSHKLKNCPKRARKHCADKPEDPQCKKLEAPYQSFSDRGPQFPELELSECELADKIAEEQKDNGMVKRKLTKTPDKKEKSEDACITKKYHEVKTGEKCKCGSKPPVSKCHSKESIKSMICKSKTSGEKLVCVCKLVNTSTKSGADTKSICGSKCGTPKTSKSNLCGGSTKKPKMKCAESPCAKYVTPKSSKSNLCEESIKKPKMKCGDSACGSKSGTPKASKSNLCGEPIKKPKMKCGDSACGSKSGTPKASKSNLCGEPIKKPKMKCGDSACGSQSGTPKTSDSNLCGEPKKKSEVKCGNKEKSMKVVLCTSKDSKKKYVCVCKPASKCQTKGSLECKPKKVSFKSKCTKSSPKSICKESSKSCCGFKLSDMKPKCLPPPKPPKAPSQPPNAPSQPLKAPPSAWERICTYFRARPNCPSPQEWKQKQLEEKARKAAAAAGLQICEPKCNYIIIKRKCEDEKSRCESVSSNSKCKMDKTSPSKTSVCNPNPKKTIQCEPKKSTSKCSAAKCKPKKSTSKCCAAKCKQKNFSSKCSRTKCKPKKSTSRCSKKKCTRKNTQKKTTSKCCASISSEMSRTRNKKSCKPSKASTTSKTEPKPSSINQKKHFCTYVAKNKYFSANCRYRTAYNQMKKGTNRKLSSRNQIYTVSNSLNYSKGSAMNNISRSYLRLNNNYVGKIYELKLRKIGIKNALIPQNAKDDPYTICHVCKVIPKHQLLHRNSNANMNMNIKINSERRQNM